MIMHTGELHHVYSRNIAGKPDQLYRIFILDDSEHFIRFAKHLLEYNEHIIVQTHTRLKHARDKMQDFNPHLVLLDIHLPDGKGWELAVQMRTDPAFAHTPIIMVSGMPREELLAEIICRGVTRSGCLAKPVMADTFIQAVGDMLPHPIYN